MRSPAVLSTMETSTSGIRRSTFTVLPGRGGRRYSQYRFPQSAAGVAAILAADATGPVSEARRRFFFLLHARGRERGVPAATYAVLFAVWALGSRHPCPGRPRGSSARPTGIMGRAASMRFSVRPRSSWPWHLRWVPPAASSHGGWYSPPGLALGLAFNCKQPLGIFVLPVMAALYDPAAGGGRNGRRLATVAALLAAGVAVCEGYEWYKFPPGSTAGHAELLKIIHPDLVGRSGHRPGGLLGQSGRGGPFYNPSLLLCVRGMRSWHRSRRLFCLSLLAAIGVFRPVHLFAHLLQGRHLVGSPLSHPRLRRAVDHGSRRLSAHAQAGGRRPACGGAAGAGRGGAGHRPPPALHRARVAIGVLRRSAPELYFHPAVSHLINRPHEIVEILSAGDTNSVYYLPPYRPTFPSYIFLDSSGNLYSGARESDVIDSFRPWWASLRRLDPRSQPVDIGRTAALLLVVSARGPDPDDPRYPAASASSAQASQGRSMLLSWIQSFPGPLRTAPMLRWPVALAGLWLTIFSVVALTGPGQNDSTDGQVRYLVSRSLVGHGDVDIPDSRVDFTVLPGRGGRRFSTYRFPQSVAGARRSWPPTPPAHLTSSGVSSSSPLPRCRQRRPGRRLRGPLSTHGTEDLGLSAVGRRRRPLHA